MAIPSGYSLLGRIGYNDRGVYSENNEYVRGDVVYHEGSSYVALTTVTGIAPTDDNTNWKYLARGFGATELSEIDATDTSGFAGDAGKKVKSQTLIDKIAEYVMSKVVATDAFQTYLQKFLVDNCVTERSDLSLSAAQGKALQDALTVLNNEQQKLSSNFNDRIYFKETGDGNTFNIKRSNGWCFFYNLGEDGTNGNSDILSFRCNYDRNKVVVTKLIDISGISCDATISDNIIHFTFSGQYINAIIITG